MESTAQYWRPVWYGLEAHFWLHLCHPLKVRAPRGRTLRANIDETVLLVVITEQGENRNQCEEQRNLFGFPHGFARCGT